MAGGLKDLLMLAIGALCQMGALWGLSDCFPSGPLHTSACTSSQHGVWVSKGSITNGKAGSCADVLRPSLRKYAISPL